MSESKIVKSLELNRDIFISLAVAAFFAMLVAGLYIIFGVNLSFAVPLLSFFYKLFSLLGIVYAVVLIAANRSRNREIIQNYSLLALYCFAAILALAFMLTTYFHFEASITGIISYAKANFRYPSYARYFIYTIYLSQLMVMAFFFVSLVSRTWRIAFSIIQKRRYVSYYNLILDYIYGDKLARYRAISTLRRMLRSRLSKETFASTLDMFNLNFRGELKAKVYDLYSQLRMSELMRTNLNSRRTSRVIWAIKMVSSFNDSRYIPTLKRLLSARNADIRFEAIIGLIKLNQTDYVLEYLNSSATPINELFSIKIVQAIRQQDAASKDFGFLLDSPNDGVLIMGLNLVNEFVQKGHLEKVKGLLAHPNPKVLLAAARTLIALDGLSFERHLVESMKAVPPKNKIVLANAIRPYFNEESLSWARELLIADNSREFRMVILRMMCSQLSQPADILHLYDEAYRGQVQELLDSIPKTIQK